MTKDTTAMTTIEMVSAQAMLSTSPRMATVMNTAQVASATTRRNASTARYAAESATTVVRDREPRPALVGQLCGAHARHPEDRRLGRREAEGDDHAHQGEQHHLGEHWVPLPRAVGRSAAAGEEGQQELALELEHLALLVRLGVVEAEQVQDAVRREQQQLLVGGVAGLLGLVRRDARAQHDVAEDAPRSGSSVVAAAAAARPSGSS